MGKPAEAVDAVYIRKCDGLSAAEQVQYGEGQSIEPGVGHACHSSFENISIHH